MKIFLCGDVMLGRGIDQALPHPCDPRLHEGYVTAATEYLQLAEAANGPIPVPMAFADIWGDALEELTAARPDARVINLETSITRSEEFDPKGINYRMSPENAGCLTTAAIDCCGLANNHVLDWGRAGLEDTLSTLERLHIKTAGAGRDLAQAATPAILDVAGQGRLLVLSFASTTSGTPRHWAARPDAAGVNLLPGFPEEAVAAVTAQVAQTRQPGDVVIVSIHWGPNWGYDVAESQRRLAHALIDAANVSVVHGHSSHHAKGLEVHNNRLIIYGCGDFLNDYEGIRGYEEFRDDLSLMYFASIDPANADLVALDMAPLQIRRFRLNRASREDAIWLQQTLDRESRGFGTRVHMTPEGRLALSWSQARATAPA